MFTWAMALRDDHFARTRAALLAAATARFEDFGYEATSLAAIAADVGATTGALYHHFENKRALFAQVAEATEQAVLQTVMQQIDTQRSAAQQIIVAASASLDAMADPRAARILLEDAPQVLGHEAWREIEFRYGLGALTALFSALGSADAAELRARLFLVAILEAALIINRSATPQKDRAEAIAALTAVVQAFSGSLD